MKGKKIDKAVKNAYDSYQAIDGKEELIESGLHAILRQAARHSGACFVGVIVIAVLVAVVLKYGPSSEWYFTFGTAIIAILVAIVVLERSKHVQTGKQGVAGSAQLGPARKSARKARASSGSERIG